MESLRSCHEDRPEPEVERQRCSTTCLERIRYPRENDCGRRRSSDNEERERERAAAATDSDERAPTAPEYLAEEKVEGTREGHRRLFMWRCLSL